MGFAPARGSQRAVYAGGLITMKSLGVATITSSYQGFTAQAVVTPVEPFIVIQPQNLVVVAGSNATFSVDARGAGLCGLSGGSTVLP